MWLKSVQVQVHITSLIFPLLFVAPVFIPENTAKTNLSTAKL